MFTAAFLFEPGVFDDRYFALDALIDAAAKATPGFLGQENWQSADGQRVNATYYWASESALQSFARHPKHVEAKAQYKQWYRSYQVVISQVIRAYGDGAMPHITQLFEPTPT